MTESMRQDTGFGLPKPLRATLGFRNYSTPSSPISIPNGLLVEGGLFQPRSGVGHRAQGVNLGL